MGTLMSSF